MAASASTLPLNCSVCPKNPTFSDVSHLLTHVSSKGHLSRYYQVKIRSAHDSNARENIQQYDQWYADWEVEKLMSDRMHSKDRKRPRARSQVAQPQPAPKRRKSSQATDPTLSYRVDSPFDYQEYHPIPTNPFIHAPLLSKPKSNRPRLYLWPANSPGSFDATPLEPSSSPQPTFVFGRSAPLAHMMSRTALMDDDDELESIPEVTKLKGIFWPGMDIFDSATPDTKKKRNQKKAISVAESLERNSSFIEPNEMIFTPLGTLRTTRFITGQPAQDSSPFKLDPTPPRQKRKSSRAALADKDTNASSSRPLQPDIVPFRGFGPIGNAQGSAQPKKKTKRNFKIYDERSDQPQAQTQSVGNASGMNLLTSAFTHHSPPFDSRMPPAMSGFGNMQPVYRNTFFADAFEHYQPAYFGMPYYGYGYGYYGGPHADMAGFMPLTHQHQQNGHDAAGQGTEREEQEDILDTVDTETNETHDDNDDATNDASFQDDDGLLFRSFQVASIINMDVWESSNHLTAAALSRNYG